MMLLRTAAPVALIALAACGSDADAPTPQAAGPAAQVAALERNGDIPVLDRSAGMLGPDADGNGVRDDIDRYLDTRALPAPARAAAERFARTLQQSLLANVNDPDSVDAASEAMMLAQNCLHARLRTEGTRMVVALESLTANTRERALQYMRYNAALSGQVFRLPSGDTCND